MASDREVLREIWEGKLPVAFRLAPDEVTEFQDPLPCFLMVPRLSYFPLVTDKVRKHFAKFIDPDNHDKEMWLECNGIALKWHYPIGLLFDMNKEDVQIPWNITVHFEKFPEHELLHCKTKDVVESYFMSRLKEADALKHKNQIVANMQRKDHNQLWLGLQNDKFDQFWAVNRKLMELGNEGAFKYVPFRCYYKEDTLVQKLVKPLSDNGERKTVEDLVTELYPECETGSEWKFVIHGIELPKDTPLQWLSEHLSYPDNFLHLILIDKP